MAAKIRDGLFIGDADTASDPDFLEVNKISNLVNLSGRELPNVWASHGLVYLTFLWEDRVGFELFGDAETVNHFPPPMTEIVDFIDGSLRHGISVLLFSKKGQSRCVAAACGYLMCKFKWGFEKAFDLILSKKPSAAPNKGFVEQLFELDRTLLMRMGGLRPCRRRSALYRGGDDSDDDYYNDEDFAPTPLGADGAPLAYLDGYALMLSAKEMMRWRGWDPAYLTPSPTPTYQRHVESKSSPADIANDAEDELVIVYSFFNSQKAPPSVRNAPPKPSSHGRRVEFPVGRQLEQVQDYNSSILPVPSVYSSGPPPHRVRGILKGVPKTYRDRKFVFAREGEAKIGNSRVNFGDLYGFVGMRSDAAQHKMSVVTNHGRPDPVSAEQRLQEMVQSMRGDVHTTDGLHIAEPKPVGSQAARGEKSTSGGMRPVTAPATFEEQGLSDRFRVQRHSDKLVAQGRAVVRDVGDDGAKQRDAKGVDLQVSAPSLYDLAYRDIIVPASHAVVKSLATDDDDPLAAFSMLQLQGGAIRGRHDLEVTNSHRGTRPRSAAAPSSTADADKMSPSRVYRRESPLPGQRNQAQQRPFSSSVGGAIGGTARSGSPVGTPRNLQRRGSLSSVGSTDSKDSVRRSGTPQRGWR